MSNKTSDIKRHLWRCPKCFLIEVWKYFPGCTVRKRGTDDVLTVTGKHCAQCKMPMGYIGSTTNPQFRLIEEA